MNAGDLAVTLAATLCAIGFAALIIAIVRVLDSVRYLREAVDALRTETRPLLAELRDTTIEARTAMNTARADLQRFDRVLGSAEAISGAVEGGSRVTRTALSAPVIKVVGIWTGLRRGIRRFRRTRNRLELVQTQTEHKRA